MRLVSTKVSLSIDKHTFSALDVWRLGSIILRDQARVFRQNAKRMERIAHAVSRRKYVAADSLEEETYDWEFRFERDSKDSQRNLAEMSAGRGKELSPMQLQTADSRMSWIRASNYD